MTITAAPVKMPLYAEIAFGVDAVHYHDMKVETAAYVRLGRIVKHGTTINECVVAGDECLSPGGVVCREKTLYYYLEGTDKRSNNFSVDDIVGVCFGEGVIFRLVAYEAIGYDDKVCCASQGRVKPYTGTEDLRSLVGRAKSEAAAQDDDVLIRWGA